MSKGWKIAGGVFIAVNALGAPYAAMMGEWTHAFIHVAVLAGGILGWQMFKHRGVNESESAALVNPEARLDSLQNAVDSIALNVERIGEAQRYQEKLVKERVEKEQSDNS